MREDETVAMAAAGHPGYPAGGATQTRQIPARVGDPRQRKASSWLIATFAALGVLAVIALVAALLLNQRDEPQDVAVPTVTGLSQDDAFAQIQRDGFVPALGDPEFTSDCKEGTVTNQSPPPGERAEPNSTVTVRICGGKPEVTIPPGLVGSTREAAQTQLENLKLDVKIEEVNNSATEGQVLKVDPPSGEKVAEGTEITLTVSRGNVVAVPSVVGLPQAEAKRTLERAGFEVDTELGPEVPADQAGRVVDQSPNANAERTKGSTVKIIVSVPEPEDPDPPTQTPPTTGAPTTPPPDDDDEGGAAGSCPPSLRSVSGSDAADPFGRPGEAPAATPAAAGRTGLCRAAADRQSALALDDSRCAWPRPPGGAGSDRRRGDRAGYGRDGGRSTAGRPARRRLETAAELVRSGKARVVLVSGDGAGQSGDEPAIMAAHLTEQLGVDPQRVVADPNGLDTYDSCLRARQVYGIERALVVTQSYHLSRAVTLCRHVGIDADGVTARCSDCGTGLLVRKAARDYLASGKAAWDASAIGHRPSPHPPIPPSPTRWPADRRQGPE